MLASIFLAALLRLENRFRHIFYDERRLLPLAARKTSQRRLWALDSWEKFPLIGSAYGYVVIE